MLRLWLTYYYRAAPLATACKIELSMDDGYYEVRNNDVLGACLSISISIAIDAYG